VGLSAGLDMINAYKKIETLERRSPLGNFPVLRKKQTCRD
jgi:hypothetical protein